MGQKLIEIFNLEQAGNQSSKGSCCQSNCGCGSTQSLTMDELVARFTEKYNMDTEIKVYDITNNNKKEFIDKLNTVFANNKEKLEIREPNLDFILSKVCPLITMDGRIIGVKTYPDEEELRDAVMTGNKIPTKPSCC